MQQQPIPSSVIKFCARLCQLAELSNPINKCCNPRDQVMQGLEELNLQLLESLEMNTFPLGLCSGFIAHSPSSSSLIVSLSGMFNWQLNPMPEFWDRTIQWKGHGMVAQPFAQTASSLVDTVLYCLRRVPPTQGRKLQITGFGLAAPVAYLLNHEVASRAAQLGFQVQVPILFACPKFVDDNFRQWARQFSTLSIALDQDWLPRMPTDPYTVQFTWPVTPLDIKQSFLPLIDLPSRPALTKQLSPGDYLNAL